MITINYTFIQICGAMELVCFQKQLKWYKDVNMGYIYIAFIQYFETDIISVCMSKGDHLYRNYENGKPKTIHNFTYTASAMKYN